MSLSPQDERHLSHVLDLARAAIGLTSPNPTVACILTSNDIPIGEGAHLYDRRDHAEIVALKQAANNNHPTTGATAYVTLEPCSHHGRTGPCADALIAAGIARCVVATIDPNPLVSGQGIAKLRAAHIDTLVLAPTHPLSQKARRLNDAFAFSVQHNRPFVTLKAALSVDGKLAPPPNTRTAIQPHWITGPAARADAQHLRHASDAILTGIGTVLADNPSLTDRTGLPRRRTLLRVILDSDLRTPLTSTLVTTAANDLLFLAAESAPPHRAEALTALGAEVLRIPSTGNRPNIAAALDALAQRNILSLLVEAGPSLNASLLEANLVDQLILYFAEHELGLDALPFAHGQASPYVFQQQLQHTTRATFPHGSAEDIRITGYLHDPWT